MFKLTCGWDWIQIFGLICLWYSVDRSSSLQILRETDVVKSFAKFTGKSLFRSFFPIILRAGGLQLYSKRDSDTDVFLWIFAKFVRTRFLQNTCGVRFWVDTQPKLNVFKTLASNWNPGRLMLIQAPFGSCATRATISSPNTTYRKMFACILDLFGFKYTTVLRCS